jgi:hypothetical protein
MVDAVDAVEKSGLACPVGPDDGKDLLLLYVETDFLQGLQAPEGDGQIVDAEEGHESSHFVIRLNRSFSSTWQKTNQKKTPASRAFQERLCVEITAGRAETHPASAVLRQSPRLYRP